MTNHAYHVLYGVFSLENVPKHLYFTKRTRKVLWQTTKLPWVSLTVTSLELYYKITLKFTNFTLEHQCPVYDLPFSMLFLPFRHTIQVITRSIGSCIFLLVIGVTIPEFNLRSISCLSNMPLFCPWILEKKGIYKSSHKTGHYLLYNYIEGILTPWLKYFAAKIKIHVKPYKNNINIKYNNPWS